jgi:putative ABC transport system permease protein
MRLLTYSIKSLWIRKESLIFMIWGIAIVVAVFVVIRAMGEGLTSSFGNQIASPDNVLVLREGLNEMIMSSLPKSMKVDICNTAGVKIKDGAKLVSSELYIPMWASTDGKKDHFVMARGIFPVALDIHEQIHVINGTRDLATGEILVGKMVSVKLETPMNVGDKIIVGNKGFIVGGIFSSGGSAIESEIWLRIQDLSNLSRRDYYSMFVFKADDVTSVDQICKILNKNHKLHVTAMPENDYYKSAVGMSFGLSVMGIIMSVITAIGAVFVGMNTMYSAISRRTCEIGALRALGFAQSTIILTFVSESIIIAIVGGFIGCFLGSLSSNLSMNMMIMHSAVTQQFKVSSTIVIQAITLCVAIGIFGGILPARRAANMEIIDALHAI